MSMQQKHRSQRLTKVFTYLFLILLGLAFIYPFFFLISAAFKTNSEIISSTSLIPREWTLEGFIKGWKGVGQYGFSTYLTNSIKLVVPTVIFTIISSSIVAYGFVRFDFKGKKLMFLVMISTLMLPNAVVIIPKYILFRQLGWLNTYLPFIIPALFACYPFFIYAMMQFMRGIPRELDEAALIDGCGRASILVRIILPLCKPAIFSVGIFQFIWTWNDFFNSLIYLNSVKKYTVMLGLRMSMDTTGAFSWNQIMAMSLVSILPCVIIYFIAQNYFVEGIATAGLKG